MSGIRLEGLNAGAGAAATGLLAGGDGLKAAGEVKSAFLEDDGFKGG